MPVTGERDQFLQARVELGRGQRGYAPFERARGGGKVRLVEVDEKPG